MKKSLIVILACGLLLSGCVKYTDSSYEAFPKFPKSLDIAFAQPHGTVSSADSSDFYISNNLDIPYQQMVEEKTENNQILSYQPLIISGLTNQVLQDKINAKIAAKIQDLKKYAKFENLPVYEGFYAAYPKDKRTINTTSIFAWAYFNTNNVLSFKFTVEISIKKNVYSYEHDFSIIDSLNIDLNTGEELTLSDLFVNGSDYQSALNTLVLLKSQSRTDPVPQEIQYWVDTYRYVGGFTGIRGDVKFYINDGQVILLFNENYHEFTNDFSTSVISLNFSDLKDILAIGQRFTKNGTNLYTESKIRKFRNYLYPACTDITMETINNIFIHSEITYDDTLSEGFKILRDSLIAKDLETISKLDNTQIKSVYYSFNAIPVGPYMTVKRVLYIGGAQDLRTTYKPDGTQLTVSDVFADGFDYAAYFKNQISQEAVNMEYPESFDLDEEFAKMIPTLTLGYDYNGNCYVTMTTWLFDMNQYPDTTFVMKITDDPTKFKIKPWPTPEY